MNSRTLQMIVVMVASLATIAATDIFLPSLPSMATYFSASVDSTQLVVPMYLMGSLIAAPFMGTLSDIYGRRRVLFWGMALFVVGTAACMIAPSLTFLLWARFLQGFGSIVSSVVGWALLQDIYPADEGAKFISWAGSVSCIAPLLAPALGGYIQIAVGWQGNFLVILICAVFSVVLMTYSKFETKPVSENKKMSPLTTLKTYGAIITDKPFLFYISFFCLLGSVEWCYLTMIPFYFENTLHISPNVFGLYLSTSAAFYALGAVVTPWLLKRIGINRALALGLKITFFAGLLMLFISFFLATYPLLIALAMGLYFFGTSIAWGPSVSRALQRFEADRGAASAVRSFLNMTAFATGGFVGSFLDDSTLVVLALLVVMMAGICWLIFRNLMKFEAKIR
jgi:MFS family permease